METEAWTYVTEFGDFTTTQIMDYYDRPLSFIAKDTVGTHYFGYLLNIDADKSDTILFTPMSKARINELLTGKISIQKALVESENGWGFEQFYPSIFSTKKERTTIRLSKDLTEEEMPDEDVFFEEEQG